MRHPRRLGFACRPSGNRTERPGSYGPTIGLTGKSRRRPIDWCFAEIVRLLADGERVAILFQDARIERRAIRALTQAGVDRSAIEAHRVRTNRSWIRDYGPIFVTQGDRRPSELAVTDWHFNGWARYPRVAER